MKSKLGNWQQSCQHVTFTVQYQHQPVVLLIYYWIYQDNWEAENDGNELRRESETSKIKEKTTQKPPAIKIQWKTRVVHVPGRKRAHPVTSRRLVVMRRSTMQATIQFRSD